ncbi:MAG TPA: hypothetical protein VN950_05210 [Terriglobales bacterium]|nr:hypothetical protein [Terriglobales bacterium]
MAEEEKGARWWFRYVIVPIIGGGGAIAIITAMIERPPQSNRPAIQVSHSPYDNQPQLPSKFRISYDPKIIKSISSYTRYFTINVYVDDRVVLTIEGDGSGDFQTQEVTIATLGNHHYNVLGIVSEYGATIIGNDLGPVQFKVKGEGTIYVQDGSEFMVNVDRSHDKVNPSGPRLPAEATLELDRLY